MLILLPPSEGKAPARRGVSLRLDGLSSPELSATREAVMDAVAGVSARDDAAHVLGVSPNLVGEIARNTRLRTAPTAASGQVYSGVLYDALDLATMSPAGRRRAHRWVVVQSALFGAIRLNDRIPAYRLSMAVNLPGLGPVASVWRGPLGEVMPALVGRGLIIDCRSSTYATAWTPPPELASRWVVVRVPGATHMAKWTRGLLARRLCEEGLDPRRAATLPGALVDWDATLTEPAAPHKPWTLDIPPR